MKKQNIGRRARRWFAPKFKADAVRLVKSGKSPGQAAEALDLTEVSLRAWIRRAGVPMRMRASGARTC